jgi:expansin (peptidoglycan-binding protein)
MRRPRPRLASAIALAALIGLSWSLIVRGAQNTRLFLPAVNTPAAAQNALHSGQATYYFGADGSGNCSFDPTPNNLMVAAISYLDYSDPTPAAYCGAYAEVTGPKGTITVRIVDKCPDVPDAPVNPSTGCAAGHLDLSPSAFDQIADRAAGRVAISWRIVSPALSGPVAYHFKDGSNQWWTAVQVRNHRNPIAKFEYKNAQNQWVSLSRVDYNYFIETSGMGPGPYSFRITDIYGNTLTDSGIVGGDNVTRSGAGQFPKGP